MEDQLTARVLLPSPFLVEAVDGSEKVLRSYRRASRIHIIMCHKQIRPLLPFLVQGARLPEGFVLVQQFAAMMSILCILRRRAAALDENQYPNIC